MSTSTVRAVVKHLKRLGSAKKARLLQRFFKTGKGEYGEGDVFWGVTMPETRAVVRRYADLPIGEVRQLIRSRVHEQRMAGFLLLVSRYKSDPERIYKEFVSHLKHLNNWDLVDVTVPSVVGAWWASKGDTKQVHRFARSRSMWERRVAVLATFAFLKEGKDEPTYEIANILLHDEEDLIQKAVGWALREAGKRVNEKRLRAFLDRNCRTMPRTTLRYAIERLPRSVQKAYLRGEREGRMRT